MIKPGRLSEIGIHPYQTIVSNAETSGFSCEVNDDGRLQLAVRDENDGGSVYRKAIGSTVLSTRTYYNLACVFDPNATTEHLKVYVNGTLEGTNTMIGRMDLQLSNNQVPVEIGANPNSDGSGRKYFLDGRVDDTINGY